MRARLLLLLLPVWVQAEGFTFRDVPFGASEDQIIESMGEPGERRFLEKIYSLPNMELSYPEVSVAGHKAAAVIRFASGTLAEASYFVKTKKTDTEEIIDLFNDFYLKLIRLYGWPVETNISYPVEHQSYLSLSFATPFHIRWAIDGNQVFMALEYLRPLTLEIRYTSKEALRLRREYEKSRAENVEGL